MVYEKDKKGKNHAYEINKNGEKVTNSNGDYVEVPIEDDNNNNGNNNNGKENGNGGKSLGKALPAIPTAVERVYAPIPCTAESAAAIPCTQVLGAYTVIFDRCAG